MKRRIRCKGRSSNLDRERVIHDAAFKEGEVAAAKEARRKLRVIKNKVAKEKADLVNQIVELRKEVEGIQNELDRARAEIARLVALQRPHVARKITDPTTEWIYMNNMNAPYKVRFSDRSI